MGTNEMKVSTKLTAGFGIAVALGVVIAVLGTVQMRGLSANVDELANNRMVKVEKFTQVKDNLHTIARYVRDILPHTEPAHRPPVVEVRTPSGHSSSYPPHKHDTDAAPRETLLEETYYHRLNPGQGFAFQRVYTDDRSLDESLAVAERDVVMVPRGYHPVVVPPGYESYYLNVMAGPRREGHFHNGPAHEWMLKR